MNVWKKEYIKSALIEVCVIIVALLFLFSYTDQSPVQIAYYGRSHFSLFASIGCMAVGTWYIYSKSPNKQAAVFGILTPFALIFFLFLIRVK